MIEIIVNKQNNNKTIAIVENGKLIEVYDNVFAG